MTNDPVAFTVAPITVSPCPLLHRHRLAGDHRLVHRARAVDHDAIDRHLLARAHAQTIAGVHVLERHVLVRSVVAHAARRLRRQPEQGANRGARLAARAQLQHLAELHQHDDHGRSLEVHVDAAVGHPERRREDAGRDRRHDAVGPRHAHAERDEREHVRAAIDDRLPPRAKNGAPPHSTTGVASASWISGRHSIIASSRTGTANATLTRKRRVMSVSSSFSGSSAVISTGSSAMPQMGHDPGPICRTSGCMGHGVFDVRTWLRVFRRARDHERV
jgi:hypothetical protein